MTFLNFALAFGAAAVVIPLIIHIFNRSRFRIVNWGAMHLLESVLRVNRRQIQLEQIILLIIRCAIPILLALCLARMVVTEWGPFLHRVILPLAALGFLILVALIPRFKILFWTLCIACVLYSIAAEAGILQLANQEDEVSSLSGDVASSTVILLDDSFSMNADGGFDKARKFTAGLLKELKNGSDASVVLMGGTASPIFATPTSETKTLGTRASKLEAKYDRVNLTESLEAGISSVHEGRNAKREIILVSDFRKVDWDEVGGSLANLKERFQNEPVKPALTFIDVGGSSRENVSVETIDLSASSVGVGQKVLVRAELRNHGSYNYDQGDLPVRLLINEDTEPVDQTAISLGPGETGQVLFTHRFTEPGSSTLTIDLGASDDLDDDDRRSVSITVLDRIGVLLVDGSPSDEWLRGETDFLKLALTPFEEAQKKGSVETKDLIEATVIDHDKFDPSKHLENQSVVVLANVASLNEGQVAALSTFVRNGGGLWICLGDKVQVDWYNEVLGSEENGLLPLALRNLGGSQTDDSLRTRVVASHFEHPALSLFNDRRNGNLADSDLWRWYRLEEADANQARSSTVLARLETGEAFIVEKKLGKGVIVQMATAIDGDWTNMPVRSCYLPLVQQIATYLADQVTPPRNLPAGATLTHFLPEKETGKILKITNPEGTSRSLKAVKRGSRAVVEFSDTRSPGTYELSGNEIATVKFVASASPRESRLDRMTKEEILEKTKNLGITVDFIDASEEDALAQYRELDSKRRFGRETWKLLLGAVLALVLLELILQRIFGKVRI
ncbi:MAG: BatA domain-containing protein [Opitutales bacterium]